MMTFLFLLLIPLISCDQLFLSHKRILTPTITIQANDQYSSIINTFFSFQVTITYSGTWELSTNLTQSDGSALPSEISWSSSNNSISGISSTSQVLSLILNAYDNTYATSKAITLTINPILQNTETIKNMIAYVVSDPYNWQVPYTAFSGYNLTYNIKSQSGSLPSWFTYTSNTNKFSAKVHKNNQYPLKLSLNVADSASQTMTTNFSLTTRNTNVTNNVIADFAINTTPDQQTIDYLIPLSNSNIMLVWESYLEDGSDFGIFAKIISPQGVVVVPEFRVNTYTNNSQSFPQFTILNNGSVLIVWESMDEDGSNIGLYAKVFDITGTVLRDEFRINAWTDNEQSTVSVLTLGNGNVFFAWQSYNQDNTKYNVYARIIDQSGADVKSEFQVNDWTPDSQKNPKLAKFSSGDVLAAWMSRYQDGDGYGIYAKIYTQSGSVKVGETRVNSYITGDQVNHNLLVINNNILITWESYLEDGSLDGLYGIIIDSSFNLIASEFRINDYTNLEQRSIQMALLPNGNIFLAWESQRQPSSNFGIFGKIIGQTGKTVVSEFHINDYYLASQGFCQITVIDNKFIYIGWESQGEDASGDGIYYKLLDFNGNSIISEQRINSYVGGWQINLKLLPLSGKNLLLAWNKDVGGYDYDCHGEIINLDYNFIPDILCADASLSADSSQNFNYVADSSCFIDYDQGQLTFTSKFSNGTNLPTWITFTSQSLTLSGLIPSAYTENFSIAIIATDNYTASNSLIVNIINTNVIKTPQNNNTQTTPNSTNGTTNNQTTTTTPDLVKSDSNNLILIAAAAGGGLLALILVVYLIRRRRKKIASEKNMKKGDVTKVQPDPNSQLGPFTTTNATPRFDYPFTGGASSDTRSTKRSDKPNTQTEVDRAQNKNPTTKFY